MPKRAQRMRWCDQCRFPDLSAIVLDDEPDGVHRQRRSQFDDGIELVGAGLPLYSRSEILDELNIARGIGEYRRAVAQNVEPLGHHIPRVPGDHLEVRRAGIEERPCRGRVRPFRDVARRHVGLSRVNLHAPAHGPFRVRQNPLLDVLQPAGNRYLQGSFLAELRFEDLLRCGPPGGALLSPVDAVRRDVRRVAVLRDGRELAVNAGMLDAVRLGHRALWWLLFERSPRQHVERFALVSAFRGLVVRLVERDGISIRRPGQHANVVPSFLEVDSVELQQRHGGMGPGRFPDLELTRGTDRSRLPGNDLHREVVEPLHLPWVGAHLD